MTQGTFSWLVSSATDPLLLAGATLAWAALQLLLVGRRDLGPVTVGLGGMAILAGRGAPPALAIAALFVAAIVAAIAWVLAAGHRTLRFGPTIVSVLAAVAAVTAPSWAPGLAPIEPWEARAFGMVVCVMVPALAAVVAFERPDIVVRDERRRRVPID